MTWPINYLAIVDKLRTCLGENFNRIRSIPSSGNISIFYENISIVDSIDTSLIVHNSKEMYVYCFIQYSCFIRLSVETLR